MIRRKLAVCFSVLLLIAGCAAAKKPQPREATIVLFPDDDGKTGSIVVSGAGREQVLSAPGQAVKVSAGAAPGQPFVLSGE